MKLSRRRCLDLALGAATLPLLPQRASALDYPTRPVRLIVGFPAGSSSDLTARLIAERLGQPFAVENRTGAGTNIATESVAHAERDGYTLLWVTHANAFNATLYDHLDFNFIRDIQPVASVLRVPAVMEVTPSVPAKTVPEFIAYAKANPGKVNMATQGIGSVNHVAGELFKSMAGVDLVAVHYRGSFFPDLLGGQVQISFSPIPSSLDFIRGGKLRALAVTTATRAELLPDIPTIGEFVPGYEATAWFGVGAPKNTPTEIVGRLNSEINSGLADPTFKARFLALGVEPKAMAPDEFSKFVVDETEKWGKVIREANIKAE
jgi:tripartite-type tricarboxylate transporter receptor subunit TctC